MNFVFSLSLSSTFTTDAPTLEILLDGEVVSSAQVVNLTSSGSSIYNFDLSYEGNFPSFELRFSDASTEESRQIRIDKISLNAQELNPTLLALTGDAFSNTNMVSLNSNGDMTNLNAAIKDYMFGVNEPTLEELGEITHLGTTGNDALLKGSKGNDVIYGDSGIDKISGLNGDDLIHGGAGGDRIYGHGGNDVILGGEGNDRLYGREDNDILFGGLGGDRLEGGIGDDILNGGEGNDLLMGDDGNDIFYGGAGNDKSYGGEGDDTISGDDGDDFLSGETGNDTLNGGEGKDWLYGDEGNDTLNGDAGTDRLFGGVGEDTLNGGTGQDILFGNEGNDTLNGGDQKDWLYGGEDNDTLNGGAGKDLLYGDDGDDVVNGDGGNDYLRGGAGNDTLNGGLGNDFLDGDDGDDILNGGVGDDTLYGNDGNDTINGGDGDDIIYGEKLIILENNPYAKVNDLIGDGMVLWLDGADKNTILDAEGDTANSGAAFSGSVSTWNDKSGEANNATGSTATLDTINGLSTVRFTNDIMTTTDLFGGSTGEIDVFVILQENARSSNYLLNFNGNSTSGGGRVSLHAPWFNGNWYWDPDISERTSISNPGSVGDVTLAEVYSTVSGSESGMVLNRGEYSAADAGGVVSATTGGLRIGHNASDHEIAEIIVFDRKLSGEEVDSVESYLETKWQNSSTDINEYSEYNSAGTTDNDVAVDADDVIYGGDGNDTIYGGKGNDIIDGQADDDTIYGGEVKNNPYADIEDLKDFGMVLWLDGADEGTILDAQGDAADSGDAFSGSVATWEDKSNAGNDATGTSATLDTINGMTSVRFTNDIMTTADLFGGSVSEMHVFTVFQENVRSSNLFLNFNGTSDANRVSVHSPWSNGAHYWDAGNASSQRSAIGGNPTAVGDVTQGSYYKTVLGNENGFSLNNGAVSAIDTGAVAATTTGGLRIGASTTDHELAEIIVFDRYLTVAQADMVEQYLETKWQDATITVSDYTNYVVTDGDDTIYGGDGLDTLYGSDGADTFVFEAASAFNDVDVIEDFHVSQDDVLDISDLIVGTYSGVITDYLQLTESGADTLVQIDANGTTGGASFTTIATLEGVLGLDEATLLANGNVVV